MGEFDSTYGKTLKQQEIFSPPNAIQNATKLRGWNCLKNLSSGSTTASVENEFFAKTRINETEPTLSPILENNIEINTKTKLTVAEKSKSKSKSRANQKKGEKVTQNKSKAPLKVKNI